MKRQLALSARQREIAELVSHGLTDKEIGRKLGLSGTTVRTHLHRAYARNALEGRVALVVAWLRVEMPGD